MIDTSWKSFGQWDGDRFTLFEPRFQERHYESLPQLVHNGILIVSGRIVQWRTRPTMEYMPQLYTKILYAGARCLQYLVRPT